MKRLIVLFMLGWSSQHYACDTDVAPLDLLAAEAMLGDTVLQLTNATIDDLNQADVVCLKNI